MSLDAADAFIAAITVGEVASDSKTNHPIIKACVVAGIVMLAYGAYRYGQKVAERREQTAGGMAR